MVYVQRDPKGAIIAISKHTASDFKESLPLDHPEILHFLTSDEVSLLAKNYLSETDSEMIRVLEDLIEILVTKNIIQFTELPETAQEKILKRKQFRALISGLVNNDEKI